MYFVFVMFIIVFLSIIKTGVNYNIYSFKNKCFIKQKKSRIGVRDLGIFQINVLRSEKL